MCNSKCPKHHKHLVPGVLMCLQILHTSIQHQPVRCSKTQWSVLHTCVDSWSNAETHARAIQTALSNTEAQYAPCWSWPCNSTNNIHWLCCFIMFSTVWYTIKLAQHSLAASLSTLLTTLPKKHFCYGECDFWNLHLLTLEKYKRSKSSIMFLSRESFSIYLFNFSRLAASTYPLDFSLHYQSPQRSVKVISILSAQETIHCILEYKFCPSEGYFHWSLVKIFSKCLLSLQLLPNSGICREVFPCTNTVADC